MTTLVYNLSNNGIAPFSNPKNVMDDKGSVNSEALCYPMYSKLGKYQEASTVNAYVSEQISNDSGVFENIPILEARFNRPKSCYGINLRFNSFSKDYPTELKVEWYDANNELIITSRLMPNDVSARVFEEVHGFLYCRVYFLSTSKPVRPVFIESFNFASLTVYERLKIVYDGVAPYSEDRAQFESDDLEPTLSWLPWLANGTANLVPLALPNYAKLDVPNGWSGEKMAGFVSRAISDENGLFSEAPILTATFNDGLYTSTGINLFFDPNGRDFCNVTITWYRDDTELDSKSYTVTSNEYFCLKTVKDFNKLKIRVDKTNNGERHAVIRRIQLGREMILTYDNITSNEAFVEISSISERLAVNTLNLNLLSKEEPVIFQKAQALRLYFDGVHKGSFYVTDGVQDSDVTYTVSAEDLMGLLETTYYGRKSGDAYIAEYDCTLEEFVGYVLEGTSLESDIDVSVKSLRVKGVLPIMTRREALQQAAFATGVIVDTYGTEKLKITPQTSERPITELTHEDFFGLNISNLTPATKVVLSAYVPTLKEERDIFDGELVERSLIAFSNPSKITKAQNTTIAETSVINAVYVSPTATNVILTGQEIEQIEVISERVNSAVPEVKYSVNPSEIKNAYFVNSANANDVMERAFDYQTKEKEITVSTYDLDIAPRDRIKLVLWDSTEYIGVVEKVSTKYTSRIYAEVTIR